MELKYIIIIIITFNLQEICIIYISIIFYIVIAYEQNQPHILIRYAYYYYWTAKKLAIF